MIVNTNQGSFNIFFPDDRIQNRLKNFGEWEPVSSLITSAFLARRFPNGGGVVCDFGANIGTYAIAVARSLPKASVIAVECQPALFSQLCGNMLLNSTQNITPLLVAVGGGSGLVNVDLLDMENSVDSGQFSLARSGEFSVKGGGYQAVILDIESLVNLYKPTVIKIDLEGLDDMVLESVVKCQLRALLIVEEIPRERIQVLKGLGFWIYQYKDLFVCYPEDINVHSELDLPIDLRLI